MIYRRNPRSQSHKLSREELRVYMMCDGHRTLHEVGALTQLEPHALSESVQRLLQLDLLSLEGQGPPEELRSTPTERPTLSPSEVGVAAPSASDPLHAALEQIDLLLRQHMGEKATPYLAVLQTCTTLEELREQGSRMAVKLKLTVNREASEVLLGALRSSL